VATYASRARDVFSELKALGESVKDDELAFNVLNGLRAEFETIQTIILASDQSLKSEAILPKLQQEENMRQLAGESQGEKETAVVYAAKQKSFKRGFHEKPGFGNFGQGFGNKGSPGNQGAQQKAQGFMHTTNQDKSGANFGCFYCGKPGHMKNCHLLPHGLNHPQSSTLDYLYTDHIVRLDLRGAPLEHYSCSCVSCPS
jgi:hypothetical protein